MTIDNAALRAGAAMLGLLLLSPLQAGFPEPHLVAWHDPDTLAEFDTATDGAMFFRWDGSDEDPEVLAERRRLESAQKGHGGFHYTAIGGGALAPAHHSVEYNADRTSFGIEPRSRNAIFTAQLQLPHGARLLYLDFWGSNNNRSPNNFRVHFDAWRVCHPHLSAGISHITWLGEQVAMPSENGWFFTTIPLVGGASGLLEIDNKLCVYSVRAYTRLYVDCATCTNFCIDCIRVDKVRAEWADPE